MQLTGAWLCKIDTKIEFLIFLVNPGLKSGYTQKAKDLPFFMLASAPLASASLLVLYFLIHAYFHLLHKHLQRNMSTLKFQKRKTAYLINAEQYDFP